MFTPDINFSPLNNNENIAAGINWAGCGRLAQARYPAQILFFFKLKMASPAILVLGIPRQGQVVILRPAGLQIFPRRDALGLTRKWALRNNKWDVIIKLGSNYKKCTKHVITL